MATSDSVLAFGQQLAAQYGLTITSHVRTPERNRAVGGAPNSDHLTGLAIDLAGNAEQMAALAQWARANTGPGKLFRWVGWGDSGHRDHVHLSFNASAEVPGSPSAVPSGSQETTAVAAQTVPEEEDEITADSSPEEIEAYIEKHYPDVAAFMRGNEAIKWILYDAAIHDRDEAYVRGMIRQTEYWRTHGPTSRALDLLLAQDPKAAEQAINGAKGIIRDLFERNGLSQDDKTVGELAKQALRQGAIGFNATGSVYIASADGLNDMLAFGLNANEGGLPEGDTSASADGLVALARNYLVPISRKDAEQWAVRILQGTASEDGFEAWVRGLAKARFANQPDILAAIEAGSTPSQYFAGHRQTVAQVLELDADQIDLMDPKWSWAMETVDKQGNRRAPTLGEVAQLARDRPEFADTRHYKSTTAGYALGLSTFLGKAA